ncbi:hypothetical protein E4U42_007365 [Claviceps africana]|uniref:Uncharacterized protein n=1 Tax=Claviceps africana TaxID=83212 RepID=A0A8K0NEL9_9HYPO|nr:hypothetical protein E4U42_007365 [Claviceps africana]
MKMTTPKAQARQWFQQLVRLKGGPETRFPAIKFNCVVAPVQASGAGVIFLQHFPSICLRWRGDELADGMDMGKADGKEKRAMDGSIWPTKYLHWRLAPPSPGVASQSEWSGNGAAVREPNSAAGGGGLKLE